MQVFLSLLSSLLFAPSTSLARDFLAGSSDLADLERREAALEAQRRNTLRTRG